MKLDEIELSQYLNAKFCHELAGTLGGINNGIEFLEETNGEMQKKAIELIKISAKQAVSRLMFYRQAYGVVKCQGEADFKELKKISSDFLESSKVKLDFDEKLLIISGMYVDSSTCKLIYCFIVIAMSNLIYGGVIQIHIEKSINKDTNNRIIVSAVGENIKRDDEKMLILKGQLNDTIISTTNIHTVFTKLLSDKLNVHVDIKINDKKVDYIMEILSK